MLLETKVKQENCKKFHKNISHDLEHADEKKIRNQFNILFTIPIVNFIQIPKTFSTYRDRDKCNSN